MLKNRFSFHFTFLICFIISLTTVAKSQDDLQNAWAAFHKNQRDEAKVAFDLATKNPKTQAEAYLGLSLLAWAYDDDVKALENMELFYNSSENPFPYFYSLWHTKSFISYTEKLNEKQIRFLEKLLADKRANGTIKAIIYSALGNNYEATMKGSLAKNTFEQIGAISNWKVLGTFDNTSASGFNKDWGVIEKSQANSIFKNKNGNDVSMV